MTDAAPLLNKSTERAEDVAERLLRDVRKEGQSYLYKQGWDDAVEIFAAALSAPAATQEPARVADVKVNLVDILMEPCKGCGKRPLDFIEGAPQEAPSEAWSLAKLWIDVPDNASDRMSIKGTKRLAREVLRLSRACRISDGLLNEYIEKTKDAEAEVLRLSAQKSYVAPSPPEDVVKIIRELDRLEETGNGWNPTNNPKLANRAEVEYRDVLAAKWPMLRRFIPVEKEPAPSSQNGSR